MHSSKRRTILCILTLTVWSLTSGWAQKKPAILPKDYDKWETLGTATLSPNGKWMAYGINRVNGTYELRYRTLPDKSASAKPIKDATTVAASGGSPSFSADSRWLAYAIGYPEAEREKMTKANKPIQNKLGLVDLTTNKTTVIENIAAFAFSEVGSYLVMRGYPIRGRESKGADLVARDLNTGTDTNFGNIADFAWQDKGTLLAMTVDAEGKKGNGVQVYDPANGTLRTLDSAEVAYVSLTWRDDSDDLAALRVKKDDKYENETHVALAWTKVGSKMPTKKVYDPGADKDFPKETRIVDIRGLTWADDGKALFFGIKEWEKKPEKPKTPAPAAPAAADEEPAGVDVWHARDTDIQPEQKVRAEQNRRRHYLAVWQLDSNKFLQLTSKRTETPTLAKGQKFAVVQDTAPYEKEAMFGPNYSDLYALDIETGKRSLIQSRNQYFFGPSASGRYALYLENDHYFAYDFKKGQAVNITKGAPTTFINVEDDHTVKQKPPFGLAGWTKSDQAVLLYDKYDIWEVKPDGSKAARLTSGGTEEIIHRYISLDPEEEFIDPSRPLTVALYGDKSKWFGYGRLRMGRTPERLVWINKNVNRLTKAKEADAYVYAAMDFADSPDYYAAGADFKDAQQITETNPFQKDYAWGRAELIAYENKGGKKLQGALYYPADYEPGKQYPMIVTIYEKLSQSVHNYSVPSERSPYNPAVFTSRGYFVLMPDIVYRERNPGLSAVECIVPAVEKVLQTGMVDRKRVGLVGHSWGAYQTAFVVTQTDMFSAAVAGAPLTDLISMYLSIYWNSGGTDARIFEISQGRMGVPFYEDLQAYMANSPLFSVQKMKTPLLVAFGNQDGAVDWHQGIELYNAARRAGKEMVLLVYDGENHGLRKKPNQIDYHRRVLQWFNHYLQGETPPRWITEGVPFLDRQKELERAKKN